MFRNYANHARTDSEAERPPAHLDASATVTIAMAVVPVAVVLLVSEPALAAAVAFGFVAGRRVDAE
jgi:hypothetical protein